MTSSNGNIFRVTGHLCGEFTGDWWIPLTKPSDTELCCFFHLRLNKRLSKPIVMLVIWNVIALIMTSLWCITQPADGPTPLCAKTSAGLMMIKFGSRKFTGAALRWLSSKHCTGNVSLWWTISKCICIEVYKHIFIYTYIIKVIYVFKHNDINVSKYKMNCYNNNKGT